MLCRDLVPCIEFWLADRNQLAHHGKKPAAEDPPHKSAVKDNGSNIDNPNIRVVAGGGCGGWSRAFCLSATSGSARWGRCGGWGRGHFSVAHPRATSTRWLGGPGGAEHRTN